MLVSLLLSGPALAWDSEPQELHFDDEYDVFEAAEYDTGCLPSGSALCVRFFIDSSGGAMTEMEADSTLSWPDALTHGFIGVAETGWFALVTDLTMQAEIQIDIWGIKETIPVWSENLFITDEVEFDPLLLPNAAVERVEVAGDGTPIPPLEYPLSLFTGAELVFQLEAWPRASASLEGRRIETGEQAITEEGATARLAVPEENPGWVDLESTYIAGMTANLDVILNPSMEICVTLFGCFDVASFEIPVTLVGVDEERAFEPVPYTHPLPSVLEPFTTHDFGEVAVDNLANLEVPVTNIGLLDLEGFAWIEGDPAFTAFPEYFYATTDATDGFVVTFAPTEPGEYTALLVIESNDPVRPRLEIPIRATAYMPDTSWNGDDDVSAPVKGCGCSAAPGMATAAPWLFGLVGLLGIRRRRS